MNPSITLIQGMETVETIETVLAATRIKSGPLLNALGYYFINGAKASSAYVAYGVSQQSFVRGVKAMNKAYRKIESDVIDNISKDKA
jgi:hypothetical protein